MMSNKAIDASSDQSKTVIEQVERVKQAQKLPKSIQDTGRSLNSQSEDLLVYLNKQIGN